ncbi:MAG: hypothetical protein WBQ23_00445 [Bacteroidota bacterium]
MKTVALATHFDGEQIRLDEPFKIEPHSQLLVIVLPEKRADEEQNVWFDLCRRGLANAYSDDVHDYRLGLIREANLEFEGR